MYYVYVLRSLKDGKYYFGQTSNIEKRLKSHFYGKVLSTRDRRPLKVIGYKTFETRSEAMWIEHNIKVHGDKKKKFIDSLFNERPPARSLRCKSAYGAVRAYGPEGGD